MKLRVSPVNYVRRHVIGEDIPTEYRRYRWIGILLLAGPQAPGGFK